MEHWTFGMAKYEKYKMQDKDEEESFIPTTLSWIQKHCLMGIKSRQYSGNSRILREINDRVTQIKIF